MVDRSWLAAVCANDGIGRLMVFGSVARGVAEPDSDVDVLHELLPVSSLHPRLRSVVMAEARSLYAA